MFPVKQRGRKEKKKASPRETHQKLHPWNSGLSLGQIRSHWVKLKNQHQPGWVQVDAPLITTLVPESRRCRKGRKSSAASFPSSHPRMSAVIHSGMPALRYTQQAPPVCRLHSPAKQSSCQLSSEQHGMGFLWPPTFMAP